MQLSKCIVISTRRVCHQTTGGAMCQSIPYCVCVGGDCPLIKVFLLHILLFFANSSFGTFYSSDLFLLIFVLSLPRAFLLLLTLLLPILRYPFINFLLCYLPHFLSYLSLYFLLYPLLSFLTRYPCLVYSTSSSFLLNS